MKKTKFIIYSIQFLLAALVVCISLLRYAEKIPNSWFHWIFLCASCAFVVSLLFQSWKGQATKISKKEFVVYTGIIVLILIISGVFFLL